MLAERGGFATWGVGRHANSALQKPLTFFRAAFLFLESLYHISPFVMSDLCSGYMEIEFSWRRIHMDVSTFWFNPAPQEEPSKFTDIIERLCWGRQARRRPLYES